ncbi:hypothetical protein F5Y18DRAFT_426931 [Xylariaceae sp. FL1019]|nr:hypothetical protein F5Y18DRAFT_426931 [Xylariaceae sp. FL1019]
MTMMVSDGHALIGFPLSFVGSSSSAFGVVRVKRRPKTRMRAGRSPRWTNAIPSQGKVHASMQKEYHNLAFSIKPSPQRSFGAMSVGSCPIPVPFANPSFTSFRDTLHRNTLKLRDDTINGR